MELRHYLRMLLVGWWIIALAVLAGLSISLAISYTATPMYRASARLVVRPNSAVVSNTGQVDSLSALDKRSIITTYAESVKGNRLYTEATKDIPLTPAELALYKPSTVVLPDANILEISVEGPNPEAAALIANNLGQGAVDYAKTLYQAYRLDFMDDAIPPTAPISPQPLRDALLAAFLGLVVGSILAIAREQIRIPLEAYNQRRMFDTTSSAYSRRFFERQLQEELSLNKGGVVSLGLVDLQGLEGLIDTLPEPIIERLLHRVARILKAELRGSDIVGRWDDVTFSVLLPATSDAAAMRTLDRICTALAVPQALDGAGGETVFLNPHVGGVSTQGNETPSQLTQRVTAALEQNRQSVRAIAN